MGKNEILQSIPEMSWSKTIFYYIGICDMEMKCLNFIMATIIKNYVLFFIIIDIFTHSKFRQDLS